MAQQTGFSFQIGLHTINQERLYEILDGVLGQMGISSEQIPFEMSCEIAEKLTEKLQEIQGSDIHGLPLPIHPSNAVAIPLPFASTDEDPYL
jgi:hypothetical protein